VAIFHIKLIQTAHQAKSITPPVGNLHYYTIGFDPQHYTRDWFLKTFLLWVVWRGDLWPCKRDGFITISGHGVLVFAAYLPL